MRNIKGESQSGELAGVQVSHSSSFARSRPSLDMSATEANELSGEDQMDEPLEKDPLEKVQT